MGEGMQGMLGNLLQNAAGQQGMGLGQLAQMAGVGGGGNSDDAQDYSHGDMMGMLMHLVQTNPGLVQNVAQHIPGAEGLLGMIGMGGGAAQEGASAEGGDGEGEGSGGGMGGMLGNILGGVMGGNKDE